MLFAIRCIVLWGQEAHRPSCTSHFLVVSIPLLSRLYQPHKAIHNMSMVYVLDPPDLVWITEMPWPQSSHSVATLSVLSFNRFVFLIFLGHPLIRFMLFFYLLSSTFLDTWLRSRSYTVPAVTAWLLHYSPYCMQLSLEYPTTGSTWFTLSYSRWNLGYSVTVSNKNYPK